MNQTLQQQMDEAARHTPGHPDFDPLSSAVTERTVRQQREEMERLGLAAKIAQGFMLPIQEVIRAVVGVPPAWEYQRPGLPESVVFIAAAIGFGTTMALLTHRLIQLIGG